MVKVKNDWEKNALLRIASCDKTWEYVYKKFRENPSPENKKWLIDAMTQCNSIEEHYYEERFKRRWNEINKVSKKINTSQNCRPEKSAED